MLIHPVNASCQCILSIHPVNTLCHPINTPYQHTLSIHPIDISYQYTLSTHPHISFQQTHLPFHIPYQHTHSLNPASSHNNGNSANGTLAAEFSALGISLNSLHGHGGVTPTLSPLRPPDILTDEIFDLLRSQARFLEGGQHRQLLDATAHSVVASSATIPSFLSNHTTQPSVPPPSRAVGGIAAVYGNGNLHNKSTTTPINPPHYPTKPNNYTNFSALLWGEADARARQKMQNKLQRKNVPGGGGAMSSSSNDQEKNENGVNQSDCGTNDDRSAGWLRIL